MKQIFKVTLVFASILTAAFSTDAMAARKQSPTDQLSQALKQAGLKEVENEVVRQLGQAIKVGAPLRLDHRTAYPPTTVPIDNFQPKKLEFTPENMNQPLEPGDYTLDVIGHCTRWSLHDPGRGLAYKLARLEGRQTEVISELYHRGTQQGIPPRGLHAMAWRIQGGVPLKNWRPAEQELVHQLIPEYESSLQGDYLEQTREIYSKAATLGKLPRYETMLRRMGPVGETVIELQRARKILANKTLAAERMPDLLYGRPRDGLPRTLTGGPNDPPSAWSEIAPGVFARLTIIQGNLGRNVLDLRVTPQARIPSVSHHPRNTFAILPVALMAQVSPERSWTYLELMKYLSGLIGYPEGRPAQALILAPSIMCSNEKNVWLDRHPRMRAESIPLRMAYVAAIGMVGLLASAGVAQSDEVIQRAIIAKYAGSYDTDAFLKEPAVRAELQELLGPELKHLMHNLNVKGDVDLIYGTLSLSGNAPHQGTEEEAVVCVTPLNMTVEVEAAILSKGAVTVFTRAEKYEAATLCIKDWITLANSGHVGRVEQPANVRVAKPAR